MAQINYNFEDTQWQSAHGVIDISQSEEWQALAYGEPSASDVKRLGKWLKENPNAMIRLYHGTGAERPIMAEGLKPTTNNRRNSYQSRNGYVSLSIFEGMAKTFGEVGHPGKDVAVYAVVVPVRHLVADKDQLANQRAFAERNVGNTLAESIAYGHGAQVKGSIPPYMITQLIPTLKQDVVETYSEKAQSEVKQEPGLR